MLVLLSYYPNIYSSGCDLITQHDSADSPQREFFILENTTCSHGKTPPVQRTKWTWGRNSEKEIRHKAFKDLNGENIVSFNDMIPVLWNVLSHIKTGKNGKIKPWLLSKNGGTKRKKLTCVAVWAAIKHLANQVLQLNQKLLCELSVLALGFSKHSSLL